MCWKGYSSAGHTIDCFVSWHWFLYFIRYFLVTRMKDFFFIYIIFRKVNLSIPILLWCWAGCIDLDHHSNQTFQCQSINGAAAPSSVEEAEWFWLWDVPELWVAILPKFINDPQMLWSFEKHAKCSFNTYKPRLFMWTNVQFVCTVTALTDIGL